MDGYSKVAPFVIRDCALSAIATGLRAQNLRELRDALVTVHGGSIYYHFWGGLLRPGFDDPEFNNDFASWIHHRLHDAKLAEQIGVIDPASFSDMEELRRELIDVIEKRLDETEFLSWAPRDRQFHFIRAQTVVFDTNHFIQRPPELANIISSLSLGSIYYHVIDARRRSPQAIDDFRAWLMLFGDEFADLYSRLAQLDPYFVSLIELREQFTAIFKEYFTGSRA
ncbi:MAG: hypothetical protein HY081_02570 [Gammaproteobacteria bacterium]|nr:hypothetical protein [Gammaproteobacteria bacterium]